jgi:prophage tail gpP-like protein
MSGILNAFGPISQSPDELAIVVGGNRIVGWETAAVTASVEHFPRSFVLTATDQFPDDPTRATIFPGGPGAKCQIFIGSDLVLTGYVDSYSTNIGGGRHDVTIVGRGLGEDLSDCSADLLNSQDLRGATITASNTRDLAAKLCKPFGITVKLAASDAGIQIPAFTIHLGETSYQILERVCRYAAYLLYEDETGALVLDRVGTNKMASGFTMPGNIEGASSTLSVQDRFSDYCVVFSTIDQYAEISPLINQLAKAKDPTVPRYRPRIIQSEQYSPYFNYAQARANWEMARRIGRSQAISVTCDSWRDSAGMLWQPNYLATIDAPNLKIINAQWVIGDVTYRKDASGTHSDITLMPKEAFDPEPSPLNLFDRETFQSVAPGGAATPAANGLQGHA